MGEASTEQAKTTEVVNVPAASGEQSVAPQALT